MHRQVGRLVAAVAVVGAVVSGCGGDPNQTGAAVIVGAEAVPLAQVQSRIGVALSRTDIIEEAAAQGVGTPDIARILVTQTVRHELFDQVAATEAIVVTEADVDTELAARGGDEVALAESPLDDLTGVRERIHDDLVAEQLARRQVDGLAVTADLFLGATTQVQAQQAQQIIAAGGPRADALFESGQADQTSFRGEELRATVQPEIAASVLFGTPVGYTGYFQPQPGSALWIVFRVLERRTGVPPPDGTTVSPLSRDDLIAIGVRLLQPAAEQLGVRVNPRYGVWDPVSLRVLAQDQVTGAVLPPRAG